MTLIPTLRLSLEMTNVLAHIEQNGIKINKTTLAEIREEYEQELFQLERRLNELAANATIHLVQGTLPFEGRPFHRENR